MEEEGFELGWTPESEGKTLLTSSTDPLGIENDSGTNSGFTDFKLAH